MVLLDSDGQHDPDEIPVLINSISEDGYDLVAGSRKLKQSKSKGKRPLIRPLGQFVLKIGLGRIIRRRDIATRNVDSGRFRDVQWR
jgi:hypothetical protein